MKFIKNIYEIIVEAYALRAEVIKNNPSWKHTFE